MLKQCPALTLSLQGNSSMQDPILSKYMDIESLQQALLSKVNTTMNLLDED